MSPLTTRTHHSETDRPEQPEESNDQDIQCSEQDPVNPLVQLPCGPINTEPTRQDREIESRIVVMHISDTTHSDERNVVQEPSDNRVDTCVVDLVNVGLFKVIVAPLPAYEVPHDHEGEDAEGGGAAPVDSWVTEKEVFHD